MPQYVDLHLHTSKSDGTLTPAELLKAVRSTELTAFSITDHDTIDGYREVAAMITNDDPELVSGLEMSVAIENGDIHLLAYLFEPDHEELTSVLERLRLDRDRRGRQMVEKLNELGLDMSFESVEQAAKGATIGRPHIAEALVTNGLVDNFGMAFRKYIGNDCEAYIPKSRMSPSEAINLIHRAGGVAVLAHPFVNEAHRHIEMLANLQLDGLEVYHYSHSRQKIKELKRVAGRYGLALSGGSDFHGRQEHEGGIGAEPVPLEYLDELKDRAQKTRGTT